MSQYNNNNTGEYGDPAPGSYASQPNDSGLFETFRAVQEYLDEEARGGNNEVKNEVGDDDENGEYDNEDDDNEYIKTEVGSSHAANDQDVYYDEMDFDAMGFNQGDPSLNDINFGFDMGDSLYPSSPIIKSTPIDGPEVKDEEDLFGESPKASPASQGASGPAVPRVSLPTQAPEPSVPQPTLTLPQLDSAELDYTLSLPSIDPLITAEVPSAAQPSPPSGLAYPQSYLSQPGSSTVSNLHTPDSGLAVPNNDLYFPDQLDNILADTTNPNPIQGQYPLGPLLGQGNGGRAATGQSGYGDQYQYGNQPYGNSAYPMPPNQQRAGQYDMYSNTQAQQQFMAPAPSTYRQSTGPQNGYTFPMSQNITPPINLADVGRLSAFDLRAPAPNQATYPPPTNGLSMDDPPHPLNRGRISHRRSRKASSNNDTLRFYVRPPRLASWGPLVPGPRQPEPVFRYYKHFAELRPALTFSVEQLITFFMGTGHPYPGRKLTLWVQNVAAQSNDRYANGGASTKCRYKHCPASQNTILKGFFRIAFDEFSDRTGDSLDPMQNAGYMHLHCFEKLFDLGYLIHHGAQRLGFRILPDRRVFAHETKNAASITRDHNEMSKTYDEWVESQRGRADYIESVNQTAPSGRVYTGLEPKPNMVPPHSKRLGCKLIAKHLDLQVKGRALTRDSRGGPHIGIHKGDLDLLVHLKRRSKKTAPPPTQLETQQGGQSETQQGSKLQLQLKPQQQTQQEAQQSPATQDRLRKRSRDDDDEEYIPSTEQRPRQRRRVDEPSLLTPQPRYHTRSEAEPSRGTKRAIDDLESGSTSPDSMFKRSRRATQAYNPHNPPENRYTEMPLSAYVGGDSILALGDDDYLDEEPEMVFRGPQPNWYAQQQQQQPTPTTTPPTNTYTNTNTYTTTTTMTTPTPTPHYPTPPHTRSRSRQDSASIVGQLTTPSHHLTRASAHAIQSQLEAQPAHVREQVLAAVPAEYAALVQPSPPPAAAAAAAADSIYVAYPGGGGLLASPGRGGGGGRVRFEDDDDDDGMDGLPRVHDDRLEVRVAGLEADQRRAVEKAVVKEERKGREEGRRKVQSL